MILSFATSNAFADIVLLQPARKDLGRGRDFSIVGDTLQTASHQLNWAILSLQVAERFDSLDV